MGMMGNMFGPNGNTQTATMSFNNMNDLNNRMQNMFEGLGIRLPQPPQQPQQPRQPQQPQ